MGFEVGVDGVQITTIYHPPLSVAPVMDHNGLAVGGIVNRCFLGAVDDQAAKQ